MSFHVMCITFTITAVGVISKKVEHTSAWVSQCLNTFPLEGFVGGFTGGLLGRAATLPLDLQNQSPLAQMVKVKTGTARQAAVLYRFGPFWALRASVYGNSIEHFGSRHADSSAIMMAPYFAAVGAWSEAWMRLFTNTFNKVRYHRDLTLEAGNANASIASTMATIWKEHGAMGFFQDTAKYRVECARVGVLFGVYHTARNTVLSAAAGKPEDASIATKAVVDFVCGAAGGAVSVAATHGLRQSAYDPKSVFAQRCMPPSPPPPQHAGLSKKKMYTRHTVTTKIDKVEGNLCKRPFPTSPYPQRCILP